MNRAFAQHPLRPGADWTFDPDDASIALEYLGAGKHFGNVEGSP